MSRVFLRRGRILPGPLKVLQQAERRSPVPAASIALTSAIMAAGLLLMPQFAQRASVDPNPMAELADTGSPTPEASASAVPASLVIAATPAPAEPVVAAPPAQAAGVAPEPAPPASVKQAAAAPSKPAVDRSLFQLDLLPVLQAGGVDLDGGVPSAAASPKAALRTPARRTTTANRGAAVVVSDGSAQP